MILFIMWLCAVVLSVYFIITNKVKAWFVCVFIAMALVVYKGIISILSM